jgi:hypothetical protein
MSHSGGPHGLIIGLFVVVAIAAIIVWIAVDRSEKLASLIPLALVTPERRLWG